jgi:hypothetical protein
VRYRRTTTDSRHPSRPRRRRRCGDAPSSGDGATRLVCVLPYRASWVRQWKLLLRNQRHAMGRVAASWTCLKRTPSPTPGIRLSNPLCPS